MSKRRFPTLTAFIEQAIDLGYVEDLREDKPIISSQLKNSEPPYDVLTELLRAPSSLYHPPMKFGGFRE